MLAILATLYFNAQVKYCKFVLIPYGKCWMIKWKNCALYIPSPMRISAFPNGLESRLNDLHKKYTFRPFVEVEKGDVVCDVGAYIGEFSLAIADKADKILAIEPDPISSICLCRNVARFSNIQVCQKLLWKSNTNLQFKIAYSTADSSILNVDSGVYKQKIIMEAQRLDHLLSNLNIDRIDFLKIDAEGAEPEVLLGAAKVLGQIPKIAVDCTRERFGQPTTSEVQAILDSFGFQTCIPDQYMVYAWQ